jgi:hypothetical protein
LQRRDRGRHPYNIEVIGNFEKAFEAIDREWPLVREALDACVDLLVQDPHQAGSAVPGFPGRFVTQTPATRARPSLRILYEVEPTAGRVTLLSVAAVKR